MQEKLAKTQEYLLLGITALLLTAPLIYPSFRGHGVAFFYYSAAVFAGFIFIMSGKFLRDSDKPETPIDGYLFLIFSWFIVSSFFSTDRIASMNASTGFFAILLFYYICHSVSKKHHLAVLYTVTGSAALLSAYGLYQYFAGFDASIALIKNSPAIEQSAAYLERLESRRVFSTLIYPNTFAGLLIMAIPACIGLIKNEKAARPVLIPVLLLLCANLFLTKSVSGIAALALASLFTALLIRDRELAKFRAAIFISGIVAAVILGAVVFLRGPENLLHGLPGRVSGWILMLEVSLNNLITGAGPGMFEHAFNSPSFKGAMYLKYAHNAPLQAAVELGVVGAGLFLAAAVFAYRTIAQNFYYTRSARTKIIVISLVTALTASLIHNLADFDIYMQEIAFVFAALLAVLMSQVTIGTIQLKKIKLTYLLGANPGKRRRIIFAITAAVLVLSAVTGGKQPYVLSVITALCCAGFALWSVSKENLRITGIEAPVIAFAALAGISLFVTPDIHTGLNYFSLYMCAVTLFFLSSQFLRRHTFRMALADIIIYTGALLAAAALVKYFYGSWKGTDFFADGFFPNPSLFAAYICIPFTLTLHRVLLDKKGKFFFLDAALLALFAVAAAFAYSKSGMIAMITCFAGSWIYYSLNRALIKDTPGNESRKGALLKTSAAVLFILAFTAASPSGSKMINVKSDPFYFNRLGIFNSALMIAKESPVTGAGIGGFERAFQRHNFPIDAAARYQKSTPFAHNEYLQVLAVMGLPGLAVMLWLMFALFKSPPSYDPHRQAWAASSGAYFALTGIAVHSLFYFTLHLPGMAMACAVLASMALKEKHSVETVPAEEILFRRIYFFPALILGAVMILSALRPAISFYYAGKFEKEGAQRHISQALSADPLNPKLHVLLGSHFDKNNNHSRALESYLTAARYDKFNALTLLKAARASSALGFKEESYSLYRRAIKADPFRAFTYTEAGNFSLFELNKPDEAFDLYLKAVSIEPNYNEARNSIAAILKMKGRYDEALMELLTLESILLGTVAWNEYEEAIIDFPERELYINMASLRESAGDYGIACSLYKKALEASPGDEGINKLIKELCLKHAVTQCCE